MEIIEKISKLNTADELIFSTFFYYKITKSVFEITDSLFDKFNNVSKKNIENQFSIRIENKLIGNGAIYNSYRQQRVISTVDGQLSYDNNIKICPFCNKNDFTPKEKNIGKNLSKNGYCVIPTLAKYDSLHSMILFNEHNPYFINANMLRNVFSLAFEWYKVNTENSKTFPLFYWTCPWKAKTSIHHGHCHLYLAQEKAYPQIEKHINASKLFKNIDNYFNKWAQVHELIGLCISETINNSSFLNLTPIGEQEIIIIGNPFTDSFINTLNEFLQVLINKLGIVHFSIVGYPLDETNISLQNNSKWLFHIIDRGIPNNTVDSLGFNSISGCNIISKNPYTTRRTLKVSIPHLCK